MPVYRTTRDNHIVRIDPAHDGSWHVPTQPPEAPGFLTLMQERQITRPPLWARVLVLVWRPFLALLSFLAMLLYYIIRHHP
jgi:hypothetical protein